MVGYGAHKKPALKETSTARAPTPYPKGPAKPSQHKPCRHKNPHRWRSWYNPTVRVLRSPYTPSGRGTIATAVPRAKKSPHQWHDLEIHHQCGHRPLVAERPGKAIAALVVPRAKKRAGCYTGPCARCGLRAVVAGLVVRELLHVAACRVEVPLTLIRRFSLRLRRLR